MANQPINSQSTREVPTFTMGHWVTPIKLCILKLTSSSIHKWFRVLLKFCKHRTFGSEDFCSMKTKAPQTLQFPEVWRFQRGRTWAQKTWGRDNGRQHYTFMKCIHIIYRYMPTLIRNKWHCAVYEFYNVFHAFNPLCFSFLGRSWNHISEHNSWFWAQNADWMDLWQQECP